MSMKKKLGSKLSEGVRQVQSQRKPGSAATPAKNTPAAKPSAPTMPTNSADKPASPATKPVAPGATTQSGPNSNKLHSRRVWPD